MKLQTPRLLLRELIPSDDKGMFELDANPEVHTYVGKNPITTIQQARDAIAFIRQQYIDNCIGRWAVLDKETNAFMGWAGLKLYKTEANGHSNFYELGYRFIQKYWSKGYATEAAKAMIDYGFIEIGLTEIYAMTDIENKASRHVLEKCGMSYIEDFDLEGQACAWFKISKP
jgi:[ribosomal protein S5]-alanine N-acetyltransferase